MCIRDRYEAAQADYDRLSRQLDEFDEKSASLRAEAQQLMLAVEQANADIRAITEDVYKRQPLTRSRRRASRRAWPTRAPSISTCSTPSRPGASWTVSVSYTHL